MDYLVAKNYVPLKGRGWVDKIREKGNEVNHKLVFSSGTEAKDVIGFVEMLLKVNYEYPAKAGPSGAPTKP